METKCETCDHNNDHNRNLKKRSGDALEEDDIFPNSVHEPHVDPGLTAGVPGSHNPIEKNLRQQLSTQ